MQEKDSVVQRTRQDVEQREAHRTQREQYLNKLLSERDGGSGILCNYIATTGQWLGVACPSAVANQDVGRREAKNVQIAYLALDRRPEVAQASRAALKATVRWRLTKASRKCPGGSASVEGACERGGAS